MKSGHRDVHTGKCQNEVRDGGATSPNQGLPKIAGKPPESRREA